MGYWGSRCGLSSSFALVAVILCGSLEAQAFCRTMSCELGQEAPEETCALDPQGCIAEGKPLHWARPCLTYAVQLDGSPRMGLEADEVLAVVREAFDRWQSVRCPNGGTPRFSAQFQGFVSCHQHETVCGMARENVNVVMFHDADWPGSPADLGLATPAATTDSGTIIDADMQFNSAELAGMISGSDDVLAYVVAHEVGHFLGLGHSGVPGALMAPGYQSRDPEEELITPDDAAGICEIYPPGAPLECGEPGLPAYDVCALAPGQVEETGCRIQTVSHRHAACSVVVPGRSSHAPVLLVLFAGAVGLCRRRVGRVHLGARVVDRASS